MEMHKLKRTLLTGVVLGLSVALAGCSFGQKQEIKSVEEMMSGKKTKVCVRLDSGEFKITDNNLSFTVLDCNGVKVHIWERDSQSQTKLKQNYI